jgi:hypothetical protein
MDSTVTAQSPLGPALAALNNLDGAEVLKNLIITCALWLGALVLRQLVVSALRKRGLPPADLRKLMSTSRDLVLVVLVIGTATVWIDELKIFALSLVAVAAAVVIATKELLMGIAGTFLRTSGRSFAIGDRIEVSGIRGDVVDTNLFTTTILEIGPGHIGHQQTGRAVTIPNAIFLMQPIINETFSDAFVLHTFEVPVARDAHWVEAERQLLVACNEAQAAYSAEARAYFERRQVERGIESPTLAAKVLVRVDDPLKLTLIARLPVPVRLKGRIEQAIVHRFLGATASASTLSSAASTPPTLTTLTTGAPDAAAAE